MRFETIPFAYRFLTPEDANTYAVTGDKSLTIVPVIAEQTDDGLVLRLNPEYLTAPYEFALVYLHFSHSRTYALPNGGFKFDDSVRTERYRLNGVDGWMTTFEPHAKRMKFSTV